MNLVPLAGYRKSPQIGFFGKCDLSMFFYPTTRLCCLATNFLSLKVLPLSQAFFSFVVVNHTDLLRLATKVTAFAFDHVYLIVDKPYPPVFDIIYEFFQVIFNLIPDHFAYLPLNGCMTIGIAMHGHKQRWQSWFDAIPHWESVCHAMFVPCFRGYEYF
jgi:hypothetical protein